MISSWMLHLSMNPLKQGLKHRLASRNRFAALVFIHESIKTRVETTLVHERSHPRTSSLSMNPLKQGLKRPARQDYRPAATGSLSMNPLKQGLKLISCQNDRPKLLVFIHESIKTRVETDRQRHRVLENHSLYP